MRNFAEFDIKPETKSLIGKSISVNEVFDREIIVHHYKVTESKYKGKNSEHCLNIQIELDGKLRVIFTGSKNLLQTLNKVPEDVGFPFKAKIVKREGGRFEFTGA
jgi:hypothetical protein